MNNKVVIRKDGKVDIVLELERWELNSLPAEFLRNKAIIAVDAAKAYFCDGEGKEE